MTLISHEIPVQLFCVHDYINDYPYVLAHLLGAHDEYTNFYKNKLKEHSYSILDNSAFELDGSPVSNETMFELGMEYKPSHIVIPDAFLDWEATSENVINFYETFNEKADFKFMGVSQGKDLKEHLKCVDRMIDKVDIIGIPHIFFSSIERSPLYHISERFQLVSALKQKYEGIKIHLLGCQLPNEFALYSNENTKVFSVDTSNPIISGWNHIEYIPNVGYGTQDTKPKEKLADNLDINLDNNQLDIIFKNTKCFRNLINKELL